MTRELHNLRKRRGDVAARISECTKQIATAQGAVQRGGAPGELIVLEQARQRDEETLAGFDLQLADLERQVERERLLRRLLELDPLVEEARAQVAAGRQEANDAIDSVVRQQAMKESALIAAEREFLELAAHLAPIHSFMPGELQLAEALREELRARGATLRAIGMTRHGQHVFTIGGGGDGPWPGDWGHLLARAVTGVQLQALEALQGQREREHTAAGVTV